MITISASGAITLAIAILGAVLGIMNTWRSFDRDRIRLRVSPRWAIFTYPESGTSTRFCIEITNLSYMPITVSQVGFELRKKKDMIFIFIPDFFDGGTMPRRLEPRTSFVAYMKPHAEEDKAMADVKCAFARTACGMVARGTSAALKGQVKNMRKQYV